MKTISVTITEEQYNYAKENFLTPSRLLQKALNDIMNTKPTKTDNEDWETEL